MDNGQFLCSTCLSDYTSAALSDIPAMIEIERFCGCGLLLIINFPFSIVN